MNDHRKMLRGRAFAGCCAPSAGKRCACHGLCGFPGQRAVAEMLRARRGTGAQVFRVRICASAGESAQLLHGQGVAAYSPIVAQLRELRGATYAS